MFHVKTKNSNLNSFKRKLSTSSTSLFLNNKIQNYNFTHLQNRIFERKQNISSSNLHEIGIRNLDHYAINKNTELAWFNPKIYDLPNFKNENDTNQLQEEPQQLQQQDNDVNNKRKVPRGIIMVPSYIGSEEQKQIVSELEYMFQTEDLNNNVKYNPDYHRRVLNLAGSELRRTGEQNMPVAFDVMSRIVQDISLAAEPDCIQFNEYEDRGGCPPHVDARTIGETIPMLSFLSSCVMKLKPASSEERTDNNNDNIKENDESDDIDPNEEYIQLLLHPGSLLILTSEARHQYTHEIVPEKQHIFGENQQNNNTNNNIINKSRRYSMVFWKTPAPRRTTRLAPDGTGYIFKRSDSAKRLRFT